MGSLGRQSFTQLHGVPIENQSFIGQDWRLLESKLTTLKTDRGKESSIYPAFYYEQHFRLIIWHDEKIFFTEEFQLIKCRRKEWL